MIRQMEKEDIDSVLNLEKTCLGEGTREFLETALKNSYYKYYCYIADEKVVGYVGYMLSGADAEIIAICVNYDYRRKGIAKTLLTDSETQLKNLGVNSIFLEVRSSNEPAIGLYSKMNYKKISTRKKYYGGTEDAIIMKKLI